MMNIVFQLINRENNSMEAYDIFNFSLKCIQGILQCVANNSLGIGNDSLKLYVSGE
jgi:hypothetical protein